MFSDRIIEVSLLLEGLKRRKPTVIQCWTLLWDIVKPALIIAACAAIPMNMAAATERGYQDILKPSDTKKKIIKSKSASAKFVRPIYPGGAPYICTPSGFGQTSKCFLR
ncbi:hypothetical protein [Rhizobium sp. BR 362]|uniref:hypothetical protein n=1 Tax=Rhizobium sp. BR 362 TaxID=3040670 RepID=UPI002F3E48E9